MKVGFQLDPIILNLKPIVLYRLFLNLEKKKEIFIIYQGHSHLKITLYAMTREVKFKKIT